MFSTHVWFTYGFEHFKIVEKSYLNLIFRRPEVLKSGLKVAIQPVGYSEALSFRYDHRRKRSKTCRSGGWTSTDKTSKGKGTPALP